MNHKKFKYFIHLKDLKDFENTKYFSKIVFFNA